MNQSRAFMKRGSLLLLVFQSTSKEPPKEYLEQPEQLVFIHPRTNAESKKVVDGVLGYLSVSSLDTLRHQIPDPRTSLGGKKKKKKNTKKNRKKEIDRVFNEACSRLTKVDQQL
ncbi:hypothetical protein OSB04_011658 [Centaurea solstitialis]|uniref:Uncharacterized protein n=1 Tax=Centaurea solstitialis TaxID=347529 RepID=A0AA38WPC0_9ASTR|nr:hypothetical protein OSB04_011658 [Centaurea solstitialis]